MKKILLFFIIIFTFLGLSKVNASIGIQGPDGQYYDPNDVSFEVTLVADKGYLNSLTKRTSSSGSGSSSGSTGGILSGHVFLEFKNVSGKYITFAQYTFKPNEIVTIGFFETSYVCLNGENYGYQSRYATDCAKITTKLKTINLDSVEKKITANYTYSLFTFNCTDFATMIWNSISEDYINNKGLTGHGLPDQVYNEILKYHNSSKGYYYLSHDHYYIYNNGYLELRR